MTKSAIRTRGRSSVLDEFLHLFGKESKESIAAKAGCSQANVYMYARRHALPLLGVESPSAPSSRGSKNSRKGRSSVLDAWEFLLGRIPDAEVARLADCTAANVSIYRKKKGIGAATSESRAAFVAAVSQVSRTEMAVAEESAAEESAAEESAVESAEESAVESAVEEAQS